MQVEDASPVTIIQVGGATPDTRAYELKSFLVVPAV